MYVGKMEGWKEGWVKCLSYKGMMGIVGGGGGRILYVLSYTGTAFRFLFSFFSFLPTYHTLDERIVGPRGGVVSVFGCVLGF